MPPIRHFLAKSEPLPRLENGVDVSFPLSHLASSPSQRTHWEGVRNPVAGKTLRGMIVGDRVLFYHSNCKLPGVAGEVEVCTDPVPDECAFDPTHPYYDQRSKREEPKWFMPEVKYVRTFDHFVPLALLQHITAQGCGDRLDYLTTQQLKAVGEMDLLKRGRLSVQNVSPTAYEAVVKMGDRGGWEGWKGKWNAGKGKANAGAGAGGEGAVSPEAGLSSSKAAKKAQPKSNGGADIAKTGTKRKAKHDVEAKAQPETPFASGNTRPRRSTRNTIK